MKPNITEFSTEVVGGTVTPATCLMNRLDQVPPLLTVSSEVNPPENRSESSRRLLQVQWDLPSTVTLGRKLKIMVTKVTNSNKCTWGNSLHTDSTQGQSIKLNPLAGSLTIIQGLPTSDPRLLDNNPRFTVCSACVSGVFPNEGGLIPSLVRTRSRASPLRGAFPECKCNNRIYSITR